MRKAFCIAGALTLVAVICFFPGTSRADSITVTVNGTQYDITTVTGTFTDNMAELESTPWWGNSTLAQAIATAVADDIGTPNEINGKDGGPLFAYEFDAVNAFLFIQGNVTPVSIPTGEIDILSFSWGVGSVVSAPEPGSLAMLLASLFGFGLFAGLRQLRRNALAAEA